MVNFNNYNKYNFGNLSYLIISPIRDFYKKVGEIMAVYKDPKPTKKEASDAERMFLVTSTDKVEDNNMTFKDLYDEFRMHNDELMKDTTKYGYDNKEKFIECFFLVKVKDFNIMQFEQ